MKKVAGIMLVIIAAITLVGCGGSGVKKEEAPSPFVGAWQVTIAQPVTKGGDSAPFYRGIVDVKKEGWFYTRYGNDELIADGTISPTGDFEISLDTPTRGGMQNFKLSGKLEIQDTDHLAGSLTSEIGVHSATMTRVQE